MIYKKYTSKTPPLNKQMRRADKMLGAAHFRTAYLDKKIFYMLMSV